MLLISGASIKVLAQVTTADYQRADSIIKLNDLVYHQINSVNWIDSTSTFWYQLNIRDELKKYDPDSYELMSHYFSEFKVSPSKHLKVNRNKI